VPTELNLIHKLLVSKGFTCSPCIKKKQWHRYVHDCILVVFKGKEYQIKNEDDLWEFTKAQGDPVLLYPYNKYL
jgi:hypothetical protein